MLKLLLVAFPIIAAVGWVVLNIQKPARDQWARQFDENNKAF